MTVLEIRDKYLDEKRKLTEDYKKKANARLKEIGLGGLVRRKRDGKIGWIKVRDYYFVFFPRTKKGEMSLKADEYIFDPEANCEPVDEGES